VGANSKDKEEKASRGKRRIEGSEVGYVKLGWELRQA